jgi:superfamily II DNA/RNA helicase
VSRPATTAVTVTQSLVSSGSDPADKRETLRQLLRGDDGLKNAIIFCNRKREVAVLHRSLLRHGFNAVALHGDMDQSARTAALDQFRRGEAKLLIASDVAARGLDIPDVSHVFNFDVPHHADDYVHRIGRTGRAGRSGIAITLVAPIDRKAVNAIETLTGQALAWTGPQAATEPARSHSRSSSARQGERPAGQREKSSPGKVTHLDQARSRRRPQRAPEPAGEPETMHLPAFLLRPVRVKAH